MRIIAIKLKHAQIATTIANDIEKMYANNHLANT